MKFSTLSKAGFAASVCAALTAMSTGASAGTLQDTIFAKVEPSARDRMFFRLSYINVNVKTTSKDAYDVTGPVFDKDAFTTLAARPSMFIDANGSSLETSAYVDTNIVNGYANSLVTDSSICPSVAQGLGTPCGIKARGSSRLATAGLSLGYFLDESKDWAVEAFVLAAPVQADVYGDGKNGLNGKKIVSTKMLPPIVTLGRYFGSPHSGFRPYLGLAASYAVFYDTTASSALNDYQGGGSPSDTTVRIKNNFGFGPVVGLSFSPKTSDWSWGISVGKIRYTADATLTTNNTHITDGSAVLKDYPKTVTSAITVSRNVGNVTAIQNGSPAGYTTADSIPFITAMMCDLAKAKNGSNDCNFGTYVRKTTATLDATMLMFNVSKDF